MRFALILVSMLLMGGPVAAATDSLAVNPLDAEETYELRLQRLVRAKGQRALVEHLARELKERPRAYVKAWYANCLLYGTEFGTPEFADPVRGLALAQEAAAEGSLFGRELVGRAWGDGRGTPRNVDGAVYMIRSAAELGRDSAMVELGKYYFFGAGVEKNPQLAEEWMIKAANRGATSGLDLLAEWWEDPKYTSPPDVAKAQALYFESAQLGSRLALERLRERAKKGDQDAQKYVHLDFVIGAREGSDPLPSGLRAAVKWLESNGKAEDVRVQVALADVMKEKSWATYDPVAARKKLTAAAAAGSGDAACILAEMAWRGIDQKTDPAAAIASWRELAAKGNGRALNRLGHLHWWGNGEKHGIPKDPRRAYEMCRQAAELGDCFGQMNLAGCYARGTGVEVNYFLAAKYYAMLEDRRFPAARDMKNRILGYVKD